MKIHQLPMGAHFEYEGKEYVKTGPMFGSGEGGQRLFPKYAVLKPLGEHAVAETSKSETLPRLAVLKAFDAFYAECASLIPVPRVMRLQEAKDRFLRALG
jgi:hypothetical protein